MASIQINAVIGIDKANNQNVYRVLTSNITQKGNKQYDWAYVRSIVSEQDLMNSITKGDKWLNVTIEKGKIKGTTGSLDRFTNGPTRPYVVLSQITNGKRILGYRVANYNGEVTTIANKMLVEYGIKATKNGGVPVQNAIFVPTDDKKSSHYKSYPGNSFLEEIYAQKKNENAVPSKRVAEKTNEKNINKLEDIFTKEQIKELKLGKKNGVNIKIYGNPALSPQQMQALRKGLEKGVDVRCVANPQFSAGAMKYYIADMHTGLDVKPYLNPQYDIGQISELSTAYELGLDIAQMSDPKLNARQMAEIRSRLEMNTWRTYEVKSDKSWKN